jgi:hypothetical protein
MILENAFCYIYLKCVSPSPYIVLGDMQIISCLSFERLTGYGPNFYGCQSEAN